MTEHAPNPFNTVRVQVMPIEGDLITWTYPVISGTAPDQVMSEIVARLFQNKGLQHDTIKIQYPLGPWNEPLDRDVPVIGTGPKAPDPRPESFRPPQAPPSETKAHVPPPRGYDLGPLPEVNVREGNEAGIQAHLQQTLESWAATHKLSSAEYYLFLSRALTSHAARLVTIERRPRRS